MRLPVVGGVVGRCGVVVGNIVLLLVVYGVVVSGGDHHTVALEVLHGGHLISGAASTPSGRVPSFCVKRSKESVGVPRRVRVFVGIWSEAKA